MWFKVFFNHHYSATRTHTHTHVGQSTSILILRFECLLLYNLLERSSFCTTTAGYCPVFLSSQEMEKMKLRLTGSRLRAVERSVAPTPSTRLWSWRRSSSSTCTWRGSAVWRSAAACTSPTGRSKSGSKTGGWNWKKWRERTESESSPTALASPETAWACGPPPSMAGRLYKASPPNVRMSKWTLVLTYSLLFIFASLLSWMCIYKLLQIWGWPHLL